MDNNIKDKAFALIQKLWADKKALMIIIIGAVGMLLILFSEFSYSERDELTEERGDCSYDEDKLQKELEGLLGEISGAGKVKVMITYECSGENVFASDTSEQTEENSKRTSEEYIIVETGSDEGGLLIKEIFPKVMGVAVVCEGGGNPKVKTEITMMIKAIFGIRSNSIAISEMQN